MTTQRLIGLAVLGGVLLHFPLMGLFDRPVLVGGVPLLVLYVFGVWAGLIGATAWILHRAPDDSAPPDEPEALG